MYYAITTLNNSDRLIALEAEAEEYLALLIEAHANPVALGTYSHTDTSWKQAQQSLKQFLTIAVSMDTVIAGILTEDMID
jgi:hypothetical protein